MMSHPGLHLVTSLKVRRRPKQPHAPKRGRKRRACSALNNDCAAASQDLCIGVVAANFHRSPHLGELADAPVGKKIIQSLPLDLDLELAGTVSGIIGPSIRNGLRAGSAATGPRAPRLLASRHEHSAHH